MGKALVSILKKNGLEAKLTSSELSSFKAAKRLIITFGLEPVANRAEAISFNKRAFLLVKKNASAWHEQGFLAVIQDTGGKFAPKNERVYLAGLTSLVRTVDLEWENVVARNLDIHVGNLTSENVAERIANELLFGGAELEVGIDEQNMRWILRDVQQEAETSALSLQAKDVIIVSGGARGVTASTMIRLAQHVSAHFVLLGRTKPIPEPESCLGVADEELQKTLIKTAIKKQTPKELSKKVRHIQASREIHSTLLKLKNAGATAEYIAVDVTNTQAIETALNKVRTLHGGIHAIIHGAGVIADKRIEEKTSEAFDRVFNTKIDGINALLDATHSDKLKAILLFSSVAARTGNVGQVDYAMANEVLNKIALSEALNRPKTLVRALGWGPWEGGMVTPALARQFRSRNVPMIPLERGGKMLLHELMVKNKTESEVVLGGKPVHAPLLPKDSSFETITFEMSVSSKTHSFLADHTIKKNPVIPVVFVLEWFRRAIHLLFPEQIVQEISNIKVFRGIELPFFFEKQTILTISVLKKQNTFALTLFHKKAPAYAAELKLGTSFIKSTEKTILDIPHYQKKSPIYGDVLFHGPLFRVIREIKALDETGMIAKMNNLDKSHKNRQFDPIILDGALQMALLWTAHVSSQRSLPTAIKKIIFHASDTISHAELRKNKIFTRKMNSNILLFNEKKQPIVTLYGVETHTFAPLNT